MFPRTEFVLSGEPLVVQEDEGGWHVTYRGVTGTAPFLDHALAEALGGPTSSYVSLATRILTLPGGADVGDRPTGK